MNKLLPEMPFLGGEAYAPVMPKWFTNLLRLISIVFASVLARFSIQDWGNLPLLGQMLVCILVPVLFFLALHSKGWAQYSTVPFFLADHLGMYFKHKHALTTHLGKDAEVKNHRKKSWLFVPWQNISNIRVSKVSSRNNSSHCAMLDVKATDEELDEFFVRSNIYKILLQDGSVPVAFYMNFPPTPRKVVAILQEMMGRYKKSELSAKYTKFN